MDTKNHKAGRTQAGGKQTEPVSRQQPKPNVKPGAGDAVSRAAEPVSSEIDGEDARDLFFGC
jgi:hypothetical protein